MGECVLVVDDDRDIVKAISILLEGEGYEVLKAYDGLQALDILSTREVRLVLIDVMMPKLDGLSAVMRIRETQNIPIIVLSAKRVWEEEAFSSENTVMVHIRRIREKMELNPKEPEYLKVVWGIGYKMEKQEKSN